MRTPSQVYTAAVDSDLGSEEDDDSDDINLQEQIKKLTEEKNILIEKCMGYKEKLKACKKFSKKLAAVFVVEQDGN